MPERELQKRSFPLKREDGKGNRLIGELFQFWKRYEVRGGPAELWQEGSVNLGAEIEANLNHNPDQRIGRTNENLEMRQEGDSVVVELELNPDIPIQRRALEGVKEGSLRGLSAEFFIDDATLVPNDLFVITKAELVGLAVAQNPIYKAPDLQLRSEDLEKKKYWWMTL